ncbi:hypothetical protein ZIOFF_049878 [Zingiber officinale]|uniref:Uncharacterized protein n=1 Tax=Zingiber officinale TaxID=94328 RepID=A0A8J5FP10_ZINOF|nr:hypothetical protein ZIOFF_049878 [Zingiber officinale]
MSPSASAGTSPAASTSRRLSKPRSMLASPYSTLPKEISNHGLHFCRVAVCRFTDITTMTIQIILCEAFSRGGVAEACSVVKRVGSNIYTGVEGRLSLEIIYLHLEMAASQCMNILQTSLIIRARALLAACKVEPKPVLSTYDQLLSYGAILPLPKLKLRCLRSVLAVLCIRSRYVKGLGPLPKLSVVGGSRATNISSKHHDDYEKFATMQKTIDEQNLTIREQHQKFEALLHQLQQVIPSFSFQPPPTCSSIRPPPPPPSPPASTM